MSDTDHPAIKPNFNLVTVESLPPGVWTVVASQIKLHDWLRWVDWLINEVEINRARDAGLIVTCHRRTGKRYELVAQPLPKKWHKVAAATRSTRRGDIRMHG